MNATRWSIGDPVYRAGWDASRVWVTCPDCGGLGYIRCLLHDDTMVSVDCAACTRTMESVPGKMAVWRRAPRATLETVNRIQVGDKTEIGTTGTYTADPADLFDSEADALARAITMSAQADQDERDAVNQKEKDTKSWAWHVHYHAKEVREADRRAEYHRSKLNVAKSKVKERAP